MHYFPTVIMWPYSCDIIWLVTVICYTCHIILSHTPFLYSKSKKRNINIDLAILPSYNNGISNITFALPKLHTSILILFTWFFIKHIDFYLVCVKYGAKQDGVGRSRVEILRNERFDNKIETTLASARALCLDLLSRVWLRISGGLNCC